MTTVALFKRLRRAKMVDVVFPASVSVYAFWPWWAIHGGPQPPKDLGTVIMFILGWFGTSKALDVGKSNPKPPKEDDEDAPPASTP